MSRLVHLVMSPRWCPLWLSALLLNYQALAEMNEAADRQVMQR